MATIHQIQLRLELRQDFAGELTTLPKTPYIRLGETHHLPRPMASNLSSFSHFPQFKQWI